MRGVDLEFTLHHDYIFHRLFDGLPLEKYQVIVLRSDILENNQHISCPKVLEPSELFDIFRCNIVLEMTAYFFKCENGRLGIEHHVDAYETYEDFLKSDCQMAFLVCDCGYVEIYTKSKEWVYKLLDNAEAVGASKIEIKTKDTDGRTYLYI